MSIRFERNRTATIVIMYSLYLYFLGLSLRNTSKALTIFKDIIWIKIVTNCIVILTLFIFNYNSIYILKNSQ
jgi:hypothetical protein